MYWDVVEAKPEPDYCLFVRFKDGLEGRVQLRTEQLTGALAPLRDVKFFEQVFVNCGVVAWPGEIDLAPDTMHAEIACQELASQASSNPEQQAAILAEIRRFFLDSNDFYGTTLAMLGDVFQISPLEVRRDVASLLSSGDIELAFYSHQGNPCIKRIPCLPRTEQLQRVQHEELECICAYPSSEVVRQAVDPDKYGDRPYSRRLLLVEPQLTPVFFDLSVLERYFEDPRYKCWFQDFAGGFSVPDQNALETLNTQNQVFLRDFGIGYDRSRNRVVVVHLRELHRLNSVHQQHWRTHEVPAEGCTMNSDYEGATIWGSSPQHRSAYEAFLQEQAEINKLAGLMGKPQFFRKTYEADRPRSFRPMLRPTRQNFENFVHLLDKMLSDNIDRDFFKGDIQLEERTVAEHGSVEGRQVGTLSLFARWLSSQYRSADGKDVGKEVVGAFKNIRERRNSSAHSVKQDEYDPTLPRHQDELLAEAIQALTAVRLIFSSHPDASSYEAPAWLDGDKIVFY